MLNDNHTAYEDLTEDELNLLLCFNSLKADVCEKEDAKLILDSKAAYINSLLSKRKEKEEIKIHVKN